MLTQLYYIPRLSSLHCSASETRSVYVSASHLLTSHFLLAFAVIWSGRNPSFSIVLRRNRCDVSPYIREIQFPAIALNQGIQIENDSWNRACLEQTAPWRRVLLIKSDEWCSGFYVYNDLWKLVFWKKKVHQAGLFNRQW